MSPIVLKVFVLLMLYQPVDGPAGALASPFATQEACKAKVDEMEKMPKPEGIEGAFIWCVEVDLPQKEAAK